MLGAVAERENPPQVQECPGFDFGAVLSKLKKLIQKKSVILRNGLQRVSLDSVEDYNQEIVLYLFKVWREKCNDGKMIEAMVVPYCINVVCNLSCSLYRRIINTSLKKEELSSLEDNKLKKSILSIGVYGSSFDKDSSKNLFDALVKKLDNGLTSRQFDVALRICCLLLEPTDKFEQLIVSGVDTIDAMSCCLEVSLSTVRSVVSASRKVIGGKLTSAERQRLISYRRRVEGVIIKGGSFSMSKKLEKDMVKTAIQVMQGDIDLATLSDAVAKTVEGKMSEADGWAEKALEAYGDGNDNAFDKVLNSVPKGILPLVEAVLKEVEDGENDDEIEFEDDEGEEESEGEGEVEIEFELEDDDEGSEDYTISDESEDEEEIEFDDGVSLEEEPIAESPHSQADKITDLQEQMDAEIKKADSRRKQKVVTAKRKEKPMGSNENDWDDYKTVQGQEYKDIRDRTYTSRYNSGILPWQLTCLGGHAWEALDRASKNGLEEDIDVITDVALAELIDVGKKYGYRADPAKRLKVLKRYWLRYSNLSPRNKVKQTKKVLKKALKIEGTKTPATAQ